MSNIERARQSLNDHYRESLSHRIVQLEAWRDAFDPDDAEQVRLIRREGHQLRGTGASFGFPAITDRGADVETSSLDDLPAALDGLIAEVHLALAALNANTHPDPLS